jgi:alcohol dehydrogenase class IV
MWYFKSPQIVFGEGALFHLETISGQKTFIVTDATMLQLGFVQQVQDILTASGKEVCVFSDVEPEPCLETVRNAAVEMEAFHPDWVIGLGGGSCMDAAKIAWFIYERPDVDLEGINPLEDYGLRSKARLMTIPTTAGSGSEVSQAALIKDIDARRKLELATWEIMADVTLVDPQFSAHMPARLTADSGIDVLAHAVDVYHSNWANDFVDGLSLQAARQVFAYLPRAVARGAEDMEAREKMANAATIAGLAFGNSNIALTHALSHSAGAIFPLPHGRLSGLFLPYTIEYTANGGAGRTVDIARALGLCDGDEAQAAAVLAQAVRDLLRRIGQPLSLEEAGIPRESLEGELDALCDRAEMDLGMVVARRMPYREDLQRLFRYAWEGRRVDF